MVLVGDVVAEMAERLFDAAGIERVQAAELQAEIGAGLLDRLEDMGGLVGRDVELPAEFADIGDAVGAGEAHADLDLLRTCRTGLASLEKSFGLTFCISSRDRGPIRQSTLSAAVTSVMTTNSSPTCRRSQARSRCSVAPGTTRKKAVSDRRVTVRSLSMPPRALSICV